MITETLMNRLADIAIKHAVDLAGENLALPPTIGLWRDDYCHLQVVPPDGREGLRQTLYASIVGANPDCITLVTDTYTTTSETRSDGSPWGAGGLEQTFLSDGPDKALVTEAFTVVGCDVTGSAGSVLASYARDDAGTPVLGKRDVLIEGDGDGQLGGDLLDVMREAFSRPTMLQAMAGEDPAMVQYARNHPREAYAHQLAALVKQVLGPMGCQIALSGDDPATLAIITQSLFDERPN